MSSDRTSIMSQHVTVGTVVKFTGWAAAMLAVGWSAHATLYPPHLSAEDRQYLSDAKVSNAARAEAETELKKLVLALQSGVRCSRIEIRSALDSNDRSIPNSYRIDMGREQRRTQYRHDEVVKALKAEGCPEDPKFTEE